MRGTPTSTTDLHSLVVPRWCPAGGEEFSDSGGRGIQADSANRITKAALTLSVPPARSRTLAIARSAQRDASTWPSWKASSWMPELPPHTSGGPLQLLQKPCCRRALSSTLLFAFTSNLAIDAPSNQDFDSESAFVHSVAVSN